MSDANVRLEAKLDVRQSGVLEGRRSRRRRRRFTIAVVTVVLVLGLVAFLRSRGGSQSSGYVVAQHALADGTAIFVWREDAGAKRGESVVRIDASGQRLWRREITADALGFEIVVSEDTIIVRNFWEYCDHGPCDRLFAFDLKTGGMLWSRDPAIAKGLTYEPFSSFGRVIAGRYVDVAATAPEAARRDEYAQTLFALDVRAGTLLWRKPLEWHWHLDGQVLVVGDRLILHQSGRVTAVDLDTGNATGIEVPNHGAGCVIDDTYFNIVDLNDQKLAAFPHGELANRQQIAALPSPPAPWAAAIAGSCATHGDELLFLMGAYANPSDDRALVALLMGRDGKDPRVVELLKTQASVPRSFETRVPRFVPIPIDDGDGTLLVLLDVDEARVVSRTPLQDVSGLEQFHVDGRWYFSWGTKAGYTIAVFDGTTKAWHAGYVRAGRSIRGLARSNVANGQIWLLPDVVGPETSIDKVPVAILDASTLAPIFMRGIRIEDATEVARRQLGL
jgi:hypothetical protein